MVITFNFVNNVENFDVVHSFLKVVSCFLVNNTTFQFPWYDNWKVTDLNVVLMPKKQAAIMSIILYVTINLTQSRFNNDNYIFFYFYVKINKQYWNNDIMDSLVVSSSIF